MPADVRRALRLAVIGGLSSFGPLSLDLYLPALPRVATSLHTSAGATQLSISCCLIGLAVGQFVFGPLGDRFGRRWPLLTGVSLWTVAALLCAVAPSVTALVILRLIQGFGGAAGLVLSRAIVRDLYDNTALARAFAVVALISNITPAVAPVAGGVLLHVMSWRGLFLVLTGAGVVLLAGTALFLPESLPAGYRQASSVRATGRLARALVADRLFVRAVSALVLSSAMLFIYLSLSSDILQRQYGLSTNAFSAMFAVNSVGLITAGLATVRLLRRFPPERLLAAGLATALAGAAGLAAAVAAGAPTGAVLPFLFVCVSSLGAITPTATNLAMLNHPEAAGAGSALLGGAQYAVGGLAGPVVTLAGDTAAAMSIGMGIAAAGASAAWYGIRPGTPSARSPERVAEDRADPLKQ
ncbi:MAG TPA: multidrug effflux MFS transporter [Streptosporangiaceae bacterium]|nr:multidrug effflux MFS transporter [Streptosporangiaceae bacterium]